VLRVIAFAAVCAGAHLITRPDSGRVADAAAQPATAGYVDSP
jgi:hypothetical protein